jgi:hypothetical protein
MCLGHPRAWASRVDIAGCSVCANVSDRQEGGFTGMTKPVTAETRVLRRIAANAAHGQELLRILLKELAIVLLPRGVTPKQFSRLATHAFAHAAAADSQLRNGRVNQSKVAVLTGLRRAEVRKLLATRPPTMRRCVADQSVIETVLTGWCTDKKFLDKRGDPKVLPVSKGSMSFTRLVKRYGGDVPHRAVLDELRRLGIVRQAGQHVKIYSLSAFASRSNFTSVAQVLPLLLDAVRVASVDHHTPPAQSVHRVILQARSGVDLQLIRRRCAASIGSMLGGLKGSLSERVTLPRGENRGRHTCTVTVMVVESAGSDHARVNESLRRGRV